MFSHPFKLIIDEHEEVTSTNDMLKEMDFDRLDSGYCVIADVQRQGKGQRGKNWISSPGQNLTFSFLLKELSIPPSHQFKLLQCVSLSVINAIESLSGVKLAIKWPNDIMHGNKKLCGILIENFIQSANLNSVIGIGINVNQTVFPAFRPEATSLKQISGESINTKLVLSLFEHEFGKLLPYLVPEQNSMEQQYRNRLYAMGDIHEFETSAGRYMVGEVIGVDRFGRLVLNIDGEPKAFLNGELRWLF